jgi:hypothetical protein
LYGAATVQTYLFAVRRLDNCRWIKVFVALVWCAAWHAAPPKER